MTYQEVEARIQATQGRNPGDWRDLADAIGRQHDVSRGALLMARLAEQGIDLSAFSARPAASCHDLLAVRELAGGRLADIIRRPDWHAIVAACDEYEGEPRVTVRVTEVVRGPSDEQGAGVEGWSVVIDEPDAESMIPPVGECFWVERLRTT